MPATSAGMTDQTQAPMVLLGSGFGLQRDQGRGLGLRQRHFGGDRFGVQNVPLANTVAVRAFGNIEMDVLLVVAVGAGAENGGESAAGEAAHLLAERFRNLGVG